MNFQQAMAQFSEERSGLESLGVHLGDVTSFLPPEWKNDANLAMDAQPQLFTAANSAIPAFLTTLIDPTVTEVLFAPLKAAEILGGEQKRGDWTDDTIMFQMVERVGEVSSYGDWNNNGHVSVNTNWPQRQSYLFQTIQEYGDREVDRTSRARLNWVAELNAAAAWVMSRYQNQTYFFGVQNLACYGLLNDPSLTAAITPGLKAFGGTAWVQNGQIVATANEIYADIQALYTALVAQSAGLINQDTPVVLALSPGSRMALTATNSFNVNVEDLLKKNFPNIRIVDAVQYGVQSPSNPQGVAGGNFVQMIATSVEGQQTGFVAYNEKMRMHRLVPELSSYKQKVTGGTWGSIIRNPFAVASMLGV